MSDLKLAREALELAARTFRQYENIHRQKGTTEGHEKAEANADLAARMEAALSAPEPAPGGKEEGLGPVGIKPSREGDAGGVSDLLAAVRDGLAGLDAVECPIQSGNRHYDVCPKCGARDDQNCGPSISAGDRFVEEVRVAFAVVAQQARATAQKSAHGEGVHEGCAATEQPTEPNGRRAAELHAAIRGEGK